MHKRTGFTLIEMTVVLLIVGLLMGGLLVPLSAQVDRQNFADTNRQLEQVKEALLGFAAANRRLPCPAIASAAGRESFAGAGTAANGGCASFSGFLPAATLGVTPVDANGFAVDAWGTSSNRIYYAVYAGTINGVANPFTRTDGVRNATMASVAAAPNLLLVCPAVGSAASGNCKTANLTSTAPFVVFSLGKNAVSGVARGIDESTNLNGTKQVFVSHELSYVTGNEFDDQLTWSSVNTLFSRMLAAGTLP